MCSFLSEADPASLNSVSFEDVCLRFHVDRIRADRAIYTVFGMCGDEIIERYKGDGANL